MWVRSLGFLLPRGKTASTAMERCCRVWDVLAALGGGTPLLLVVVYPGVREKGGEEVRRKGRVVFAYRRGKASAGGDCWGW